MVEYTWPDRKDSSVLGKQPRQGRRPGQVHRRGQIQLRHQSRRRCCSPACWAARMAHCKIKSIDTSAAEKVPGVVAVAAHEESRRRNPVARRSDRLSSSAKPKAPWPKAWPPSRSTTSRSTCSSTTRIWLPPKPPSAPPRAAARCSSKNEPGDDDDEGTSTRRSSPGCSRKRPPWSKATTASRPSRTCAWSRTARPASGKTASSPRISRRKTSRARPASSPRRWASRPTT